MDVKVLTSAEVAEIIYGFLHDEGAHDFKAVCDSHELIRAEKDALRIERDSLQGKLHDEHFAYKIASNEALLLRADNSRLKGNEQHDALDRQVLQQNNADLRAQLQTAGQAYRRLCNSLETVGIERDAALSRVSELEQALAAAQQEGERLRKAIADADDVLHNNWHDDRELYTIRRKAVDILDTALSPAPSAPQPCPDCDTGWPEGRMCQTCKGTSLAATPAVEHPDTDEL
jgi:chromosome segregation ATPase